MKKESQNEGTLTAIPRAARGAAPVCTSALLSLVSISSDFQPCSNTHTLCLLHTHNRLFSSAGTAGTTGGRDQVAGAGRRKEKGRGGRG